MDQALDYRGALTFPVRRPDRARFLRWLRWYDLLMAALISAIVAVAAGPHAAEVALAALGAYWLYRLLMRRFFPHESFAGLARPPQFQLVRAAALIVAVSALLAYLYAGTAYAQNPQQIDTLWLLYLIAIYIAVKHGTMLHVAGVVALAAALFSLVRLSTAPLSFALVQSILAVVGWLVLLAFTKYVLIRVIRERSADLQLVYAIQQTLSRMRTHENEAELLREVVDLIANEFKYAHVNIFLVQPDGGLLCAAGASSGGQLLAGKHFSLQPGEGIIGQVAVAGQPYYAADVRGDAYYYRHQEAFPDTRSELAVPIAIDGKVLGVLDLQSPLAHGFYSPDIQVMHTMADGVGQAIDNLRLLKARDRVRHLVELIARRFLSHQELDSTLDEIASAARTALKADLVVLYERDADTGEVIVGACTGELRDSERFSASVDRTTHLIHRLFQAEAGSYFHTDATAASRGPLFEWDRAPEQGDRPFIEREGIVSRAIIRLQAVEPLGVMFLNYRTPRSFDPQEREAHYIFADLAALAIQKAHAQRQQLRLERENLAWLVHDQSKADAATITRLAEDLLADPSVSAAAGRKLDTIKRSIQSIYNDFEFLQGTLQDTPTDNLQLEVRKILQRVHEAYGIAIDEEWAGDETLVPPALTYQLRLIANEAIMNAVRHGRATTIGFVCQVDACRVAVTIRDDGRGFDPELVRPRGLLHMQQRALRLGGSCAIQSAPGQGATVRVALPLVPAQGISHDLQD